MANQCRQCGCSDKEAKTCPVCNIPMEIYAQDAEPTNDGMPQDDVATEPTAAPETEAAPMEDTPAEAPVAPEGPAEGEEETPAV